jgi:hypothetical protein
MKILLLSIFALPFSMLYAQGNLQFNQVLTFGGILNSGAVSSNTGSYIHSSISYTVPTEKVWKIENMSSNYSNTTLIINNFLVGSVNSIIGNSPLWLKAGDLIIFGATNSSSTNESYFFSIIEFNIIP